MRRGTKLFLILGSALVLSFELPVTYAVLAEGWRGPYSARSDLRSAAVEQRPAERSAHERGARPTAQISNGLQVARRGPSRP